MIEQRSRVNLLHQDNLGSHTLRLKPDRWQIRRLHACDILMSTSEKFAYRNIHSISKSYHKANNYSQLVKLYSACYCKICADVNLDHHSHY
jgi:hypothetical protein